ncbi:MAG: DNA polymerase III subunit gamma/tau [Candidatus Levyibacteriota bacterium]
MVYYRKYRPQKIKDLDSQEIREKLTAVFSGDQKSEQHAFLFTGPKGLGKTSTARIVAKILNCERLASNKLVSSSKEKKLNAKRPALPAGRYTLDASIEPCNKCLQCKSITNGTNLDVLEIDGASNRGIDEIRDLREKIRLSPALASKKVYIIDEVHMLTTEAFNALLKTLEEPPSHAVFILCTTEPQKVPATILSRCFHISFKRATQEELLRSFSRIAKEENIPIEKEELKYIASLSDGSFRDGVKILEELVLMSNKKKITKELVEEKYQVSSIKYQVSKMLDYLSKKDTKKSLELVSRITKEGIDVKYFISEMISQLHLNLLSKVGVENNLGLVTYNLELNEIKSLIEILAKAYGEIKYAVLPQLPLEIAIVEWGIQAQKNAEQNAEKRETNNQNQDVQSQRSLASGSASFRDKKVEKEEVLSNPAINQPGIFDEKNVLKQLIDLVKPYNHSVAGVLRGCTLKSFDGKNLAIEAGYKFHKERLEERKTRDIIEKVCKQIIGSPIDVSISLKQK